MGAESPEFATAVEWAQVLDSAVISVLVGPASFDGRTRSVRLRQALVITTADLNTRLQALNLQADCDLPEIHGSGGASILDRARES
ncbi:MAG: hypothetical protein H0U52_18230 [Chloroflexi bacterium]|nr:hypothetical protein [Chloroflexota bacterium]